MVGSVGPRMNFRIIFCLVFLVHAAFARIAKDVTGMDLYGSASAAPASMPEVEPESESDVESDPEMEDPDTPEVMPGMHPIPMEPMPVEDELEEPGKDQPLPEHQHSMVGPGDEPFGSADLHPEEAPAAPTSAPSPPSSSSSSAAVQNSEDSSKATRTDMLLHLFIECQDLLANETENFTF